MNDEPRTVHLSALSVARAVLVLVGFLLLWKIRDIIAIVFVVLILVSALLPLVKWLERKRWPRVLAAGSVIVGVTLLILGLLVGMGAPLIGQMRGLAGELPRLVQIPVDLVSRIVGHHVDINSRQFVSAVEQRFRQQNGSLYGWMASLMDIGVAVVSVIVLTFYVLNSGDSLLRLTLRAVSPHHRRRFIEVVYGSADRLGGWLRAQLAVCLAIGVLVGIACLIVGVPAAVAIGVLACVFELIPYLGPFLSGLVMVLMAGTMSDDPARHMLFAFIAYMVVHFLENQVVIPTIMHRALGLSPVLVILAILIGYELGGIIGTVLAIPSVAVIEAVLASGSQQAVLEIDDVAPMERDRFSVQPDIAASMQRSDQTIPQP